MNYLIDDFPCEINEIPIDTDYRRMVQFELLMLDDKIPVSDKIILGIKLLYKEPIPDLEKAWDGLLWYYSGGENFQENKDDTTSSTGTNQRAYDFEVDSERIYTAFIKEYGIDLQKTPLHWWTFKSLLFAIPDTNPMGKIMYYRTVDVSSLKGDELKYALKIRSMFPVEKFEKLTKKQKEAKYLSKIEKRRKEIEQQMKERG